jgi:hypothetical protein
MQDLLLHSLRAQSPQIRERWDALLHVEPVHTPLGYPGALSHLIDWTLEEIFRGVATLSHRRHPSRRGAVVEPRPACPCGRNPLLAYFTAGEQVMREALVLAQAAAPGLDPIERDAALHELDLVFHQIARREIDAFCGVCQYRTGAALCPGEPAASPVESAPAVSSTFAEQPAEARAQRRDIAHVEGIPPHFQQTLVTQAGKRA